MEVQTNCFLTWFSSFSLGIISGFIVEILIRGIDLLIKSGTISNTIVRSIVKNQAFRRISHIPQLNPKYFGGINGKKLLNAEWLNTANKLFSGSENEVREGISSFSYLADILEREMLKPSFSFIEMAYKQNSFQNLSIEYVSLLNKYREEIHKV